jgi:hypothetical protein
MGQIGHGRARPTNGLPRPFRERFVAALLTGRGIFIFWLLLGLVHAVYRFGYSSTLALDDSRASELVQSFAWGYEARQPPLYEWLLWCVQQLFGTGIQSFLLVRYLLLAALGCAVFVASCHAVRDKRFAALASLSICANYQIGWSFLEAGTQTIVLSLACFCTFDAVMRFVSRSSLLHAIWLGVAVGMGFLSKHSYPLVLASLALAALSVPDLRHHLRDRRLVISAMVAIVIVLPYVIWLTQVGGDVVASSRDTLIDEPFGHGVRALHGIAKLIGSLFTFPMPWIVIMAIAAPAAFRPAPPSAAPPTSAERLAGRTLAIAVALAAVGIVAIGASNIGERYMYPLLIFGPVYVFARVERCAATEKLVENMGVLFLSCAVAVFCIRVLSVIDNGVTKTDPFHTLVAYDELVKQLEARGLTEGTAFVPNVRIAGNLRAHLPGLRVITSDSFRLQCPPWRLVDERKSFAVWDSGYEDRRVHALVRLDGLRREHFITEGRHSILGGLALQDWTLVRLSPQALACARCAPQSVKNHCNSSARN